MMQTIVYSQLKSTMLSQTHAWPRGFTSANSILGCSRSEGAGYA